MTARTQAATTRIVYTPSPTLKRFHESNARVRGLIGPVRSGKSVGACQEILMRASEQKPDTTGFRRTRWAAIRNTYGELKTTTLKTWSDWVPESVCPIRMEAPITARLKQFRENDGTTVDCEILFIALDLPSDVKKLLSLELTGAWVNEAKEMPRGIIDMLTARIDQYPPMWAGGRTWAGLILDTNAPDTDHWWFDLFEEERPDGWEVFHQPSGLSPFAENLENLPDDYYNVISRGKRIEWIKVYVKGEYAFVTDGKAVYPDFRDDLHVSESPLEPLKDSTIYVGFDFGLTPAAVFGQRTTTGQWIWFHEICASNMGVVKFAQQVKREIKHRWPNKEWTGNEEDFEYEFWGDPAGDQRSPIRESETCFEILRANDIPALPAPSQDPVLRKEAVTEPLTRLVDGVAGLVISPTMKTVRKGMLGGYCYKRVQVSGDERYHDKPSKNMYSHPIEAGEYMMMGAGEGSALTKPNTEPRYNSPAPQNIKPGLYDWMES